MTEMQIPAVPKSQGVFGALVYWITILAAILCIIGPLVAFIDLDANVINPHYEMSNIFDGMKPDFDLQYLQKDVASGTTFLTVEDVKKFDDPEDVGRDVDIRITDNSGNGEIATLVSIDTDANTLELSTPLINSYDAQQTKIGELTVWDAPGSFFLDSDAPANTDSITLTSANRIEDPTAERPIALVIREDGTGEQVFVDSIDRDNNTIKLKEPLINSYSANNASVTQITAPEEIDGHFWATNLTNGDGITQLALALGCAVGIPAMGGAAIILALKEKSFGWALGALSIVLMILVPALGLI